MPFSRETRNLAASGLSCSPPVWVVGQGAICRTRGHFVGQGDILSDKGTFVGQGDIFVGQGDIFCRTRGHFLSDKGTFSKTQPMALAGQWGKISIWKHFGTWRQPVPAYMPSFIKIGAVVPEKKRVMVRTDTVIYYKIWWKCQLFRKLVFWKFLLNGAAKKLK